MVVFVSVVGGAMRTHMGHGGHRLKFSWSSVPSVIHDVLPDDAAHLHQKEVWRQEVVEWCCCLIFDRDATNLCQHMLAESIK